MNFFINLSLTLATEHERARKTATGVLELIAREGEDVICSRGFQVFYSLQEVGDECWIEYIRVRVGREDFFSHTGLADDDEYRTSLFEMNPVVCTLFFDPIKYYALMDTMDGTVVYEIPLETDREATVSLIHYCHEQAH